MSMLTPARTWSHLLHLDDMAEVGKPAQRGTVFEHEPRIAVWVTAKKNQAYTPRFSWSGVMD